MFVVVLGRQANEHVGAPAAKPRELWLRPPGRANGLADQEDLRLRFDVLTKTKQPELCRYWTQRDRAANVRLFRLVAEVRHAIEAGVFHPNPGWQCKDCPFQSRCWAWRRQHDEQVPASGVVPLL